MSLHRARYPLLVLIAVVAGACGGGEEAAPTVTAPATTTAIAATTATPATAEAPVVTTAVPPATEAPAATTAVPATTEAPRDVAAPVVRSLVAPTAAIVVDGDVGDWAGVAGLDMVLEAIDGESVAAQAATVKMAHDDANVYALVELDDDYDWVDGDLHKSASIALMFAIDSGAGVAMGAEEVDHELSFGVVDIWHWELECDSSVLSGGVMSGPGDGKAPGNDAACNFDDEYATTPEDRHDDGSDTGENSLLGAWSHSTSAIGADGTYVFEMSRPLDTGDSQDAQFAVGSTTNMGVAYWDADSGIDGWEAEHHAQSSSQGWIEVTLN